MRTRIDYLADKYCFTERNESPRLRRQWQDVLEECRQTEAGSDERLCIGLLCVVYVIGFEL
ncbi:DNA-binding protein, partial [Escherichia coli]|nr:DNA-binding protein [Escherichia coli]